MSSSCRNTRVDDPVIQINSTKPFRSMQYILRYFLSWIIHVAGEARNLFMIKYTSPNIQVFSNYSKV